MAIKGAEGLTNRDFEALLEQGARVVVFRYCVSVLVITFQRGANVLVRPGQSVFFAGLPYTMLSLMFGWWGFPFGLIFTPITVFQNLAGGTDITAQVRGMTAGGGHPLPALPQGNANVQVMWSDGQSYPGTVVESRGGQVYVRFTDGREQWVPSAYVRHG